MLPPTEGRADSRMARPPRSEPLSTDALSDPVSLEGYTCSTRARGTYNGRWRTVARTTESTGKEAAGKTVKTARGGAQARESGQSEAAGRTQVRRSSPTLSAPPILALCSSDRKSIGHGGQPAGPEPAWHGYRCGSAPGPPRRQRGDHREQYGRLRSNQPPSVSKPDPLYQR